MPAMLTPVPFSFPHPAPMGYLSSFSVVVAQLDLGSGETPQQLFRDFTLWKLLQAAIAVALAYGLLSTAESINTWLAHQVPSRFRLLTKQSVPLLKGIILVCTVVFVVNLFIKLSPSNVIALTGTLAVGLGFAFKDYISSIIAGVVALFETPYRMGDRVKIGQHYGEVVQYGLRNIKLKTPDDNTVTIPHNRIWTEAVSNANDGALEAQVVSDFYFGHGVDVECVIRILYQAAYTSKYTQLKLPILVVMDEKPWGTHFKLKCYPMDAQNEFVYKTDLIRRAKRAFSQYDLPYPVFATDDRNQLGENFSDGL